MFYVTHLSLDRGGGGDGGAVGGGGSSDDRDYKAAGYRLVTARVKLMDALAPAAQSPFVRLSLAAWTRHYQPLLCTRVSGTEYITCWRRALSR